MCGLGKKMVFCTCEDGTNGKKIEGYEWSLIRYIGSKETNVRGKIMSPSKDLGNNIEIESILLDLNSRNCFDFEYQPQEMDRLQINTSGNHSRYKYFNVIFKKGKWQEGSHSKFTTISENISSGKIKIVDNATFTLKRWHEFVATKNPQILDELLADEAVFHSPVVWTPQEGKQITKLYLTAAVSILNDENANFSYVKEIVQGNHLILEFVANIDDVSINGVDMIELNNEGEMIDFKVMIRPLKAIHKIHEKMGELLQKYKSK